MSDFQELNGLQRKILRTTIAESFDRDEFSILLSDEFDTPLARIAGSDAFEVQIFTVIERARRRRELKKLIQAVVTSRPHIGRELAFAAPVAAPGTAALDASGAPIASQGRSKLEGLIRNGEGIDRYGPMVERYSALASQVCRIEAGIFGTGFLVAPDLVLTNYHVIEREWQNKARFEEVVCRFDYLSETSRGVGVRLAKTDWCIAFTPYAPGDETSDGRPPGAGELDYALLRLARPVDHDKVDASGRERGTILVSASAAIPGTQRILFIAQHPDTAPLSSSLGLSLGAAASNLRLRYTAETLGGSSGAPVFDGDLSLVAVHHAGQPGAKLHPGEYNQGIPIALIVADLASKQVQPFWE